MRSKPLMTLMTMISTATPSVTPMMEIRVMADTNVRLGRKYRSARASSNGSITQSGPESTRRPSAGKD